MSYTIFIVAVILWCLFGILGTLFVCKAAEYAANEKVGMSLKNFNIAEIFEDLQCFSLWVAIITFVYILSNMIA